MLNTFFTVNTILMVFTVNHLKSPNVPTIGGRKPQMCVG